MGELLALMIPIIALSIPIVAIVAQHRQKLAEMQIKSGRSIEGNTLGALQSLKNEMQELRDTTTRYDMSFDSALQRIESRVVNLEGRVVHLEQQSSIQQGPR